MNDTTTASDLLHEGRRFPSPFGRAIALGYYDGPTNGLVELRSSGTTYKFDMLGGDDLRFYSLAPPPGSVEKFVRLLSSYQQPRWPVWCPLWSFPSEAVQVEVERETDAILAGAGPVEWVIATEDFQGEVIAARHPDWYAFLGIGRQPPWVAAVGS